MQQTTTGIDDLRKAERQRRGLPQEGMNMIKIASRFESYTAQELIDAHRKYSYHAGCRAGTPYTELDKVISEAIDPIEKELVRRIGGMEK